MKKILLITACTLILSCCQSQNISQVPPDIIKQEQSNVVASGSENAEPSDCEEMPPIDSIDSDLSELTIEPTEPLYPFSVQENQSSSTQESPEPVDEFEICLLDGAGQPICNATIEFSLPEMVLPFIQYTDMNGVALFNNGPTMLYFSEGEYPCVIKKKFLDGSNYSATTVIDVSAQKPRMNVILDDFYESNTNFDDLIIVTITDQDGVVLPNHFIGITPKIDIQPIAPIPIYQGYSDKEGNLFLPSSLVPRDYRIGVYENFHGKHLGLADWSYGGESSPLTLSVQMDVQ